MAIKKEFENIEDAKAYIERIREINRNKSRNYYQNNIKLHPEKYQKYLDRCKKNNHTYYHKCEDVPIPEIPQN